MVAVITAVRAPLSSRRYVTTNPSLAGGEVLGCQVSPKSLDDLGDGGADLAVQPSPGIGFLLGLSFHSLASWGSVSGAGWGSFPGRCSSPRVLVARSPITAAARMKMLPRSSARWKPAVRACAGAAWVASRLCVRLVAS